MAEVNLSINGRSYSISCDDGQERRVTQLGEYIDGRLKEISKAGAANNELHLLVLTSLMIADELMEARDESNQLSRELTQLERSQGAPQQQQEGPDAEAIVYALDQLAGKIDAITGRIHKA